jgi:polyferredoxin
MECVGCTACIDACDEVMDKMSYPRGLIRYTTEQGLEKHWSRKEILGHIVRPRIIVYTTILILIILGLVWGVANKPDLRVNVIRDRGVLAREVEGGVIENVYRLQVMNVSEQTHRYGVSVTGLDSIKLEGETQLEVSPATTKSFSLSVRVPPESGKKGSHMIYFDVKAEGNEKMAVHEKATFLMP